MLNTRWSGVMVALKRLDRDSVLGLTRASFDLPRVRDASSDTDGLANSFKEADVAFPMKGNENLLRILAGVTLAQCIESDHAHADFAALCVASASCQGLRPPPSIEELNTIAQQHLKREGQ